MNELAAVTMLPGASRLEILARDVDRHMDSYVAAGRALAEIRDARLYEATHFTFEQFCVSRWGMTKTHANRLIQAACVVDNLAPIGVKLSTQPRTESVARALATLEPDEQRKVWSVATERWAQPTAANVAQVVRESKPQPQKFAAADDSTPPKRQRHLVLQLEDFKADAAAISTCLSLEELQQFSAAIQQRIRTIQSFGKGKRKP